MDLLVKTLKIS